MKKVLLSAAAVAAFLFSNSAANAQNTGNVVMTVTTADVIALAVPIPAVAFVLSNSSMYENDQNVTIPAQVTVLSTKPFDLDVKSSSSSLSFLTNNIPLNVIQVAVANTDLGVSTPTIDLSQSNQKLLDEVAAGTATALNMKYTLRTKTRFSDFASAPAGVYTATLLYTASID